MFSSDLFEDQAVTHGALYFKNDSSIGLKAIIALAHPERGPGLGGVRLAHYASADKAIKEASQLARCMAFKSAIHRLPFSGAKAVLIAPDHGIADRVSYFRAFGRFVESLKGQYISAVDSGVQESDMNAVAQETRFSTNNTARGGDPSEDTARGVALGIWAAVQFKWPNLPSMEGVHVLVQGIGSVGLPLVRLLRSQRATVTVADLNEDVVQFCRYKFGTFSVSPYDVYHTPCDVFAPCAPNAGLDLKSLSTLKAKIIAGATNNPLQNPSPDSNLLNARDILYVPDFVINAGGLIRCAQQYLGSDKIQTEDRIQAIAALTKRLLEQAKIQQVPPLTIAEQWASNQS